MSQRSSDTTRISIFEGTETGTAPFYNTREVSPPPTPSSFAPPPSATPPPPAPQGTLPFAAPTHDSLVLDEANLATLIRDAATQAVTDALTTQPPLGAGVHTSRRRSATGFSILRVIGAMVGKYNRRDAGYELDLLTKFGNQMIEIGWKPAGDHTGFAMPNNETLCDDAIRPLALEIREAMQSYTTGLDPDELLNLRSKMPPWYARDLSPLNDATGGTLIPLAQQGDFIELLRAKARVIQAGANVVPMPASGSARYPRQASSGTGYRVGVSQSITESTPGTGFVTLSAKKVGAIYDFPNEFFRFANPGIEAFVRMDLAKVIALKIDQDCLEGAADGVGIKGILLHSQSAADTTTAAVVQLIAASTAGANGDTVEFSDGDKMITALEEAKANSENATFIMRPAKRRNIFSRRADAVSAADAKGPFLGVPYINQRPRVWFDAPVLTTTQITNNRIKGSGTNLTYIVCGDWTDYLLAMMGVTEITFNPYDTTLFQNDATRVRAIQQCDGAPRHEESFSVMDSLLPTT